MGFAQKTFSIFKRDVLLFILNVVTSIIIARKLGPELLGVWVAISLIPSYAEAFGRIKFDLAAIYFIGKKRYSEKEAVYHLNLVAFITAFLISILILILRFQIVNLLFNGDTDNLIYIYAILPIIFLKFYDLNYSYLLISREDVKSYNIMIIIKAIIGSGGASILLIFFDFRLWSIVAMSLLSVVFSLTYGRSRFNKRYTGSKTISTINKALLIDFFHYSFKLYIGGIISYLNVFLMKSFLAIYISSEKLAFYSLAQDRATLMNKISKSANTLLYPRVSRLSRLDSIKTTTKAFRIIFILGVMASIIFSIVIKPLVFILYGIEYLPMVKPFLVILPGILLSGSCDVFTSYFSGVGRSDLVMKLAILPLLLQIVLALFLVEDYGIIGAALSFSFGMILFSVLQVLFFLNITDGHIKHLFPRVDDFRYIIGFFTRKLVRK